MTKPVELRVGGQTYRVVSSASPDELERLAAVVDERLAALVPAGRPMPTQAMLLAAIALAHDLEVERERSQVIAARSREAFVDIVSRVDRTLARAEETLRQGEVASEPR